MPIKDKHVTGERGMSAQPMKAAYLLLVCLLSLVSAVAGADTLEQVRNTHSVKVLGYVPDFAPFSTQDGDRAQRICDPRSLSGHLPRTENRRCSFRYFQIPLLSRWIGRRNQRHRHWKSRHSLHPDASNTGYVEKQSATPFCSLRTACPHCGQLKRRLMRYSRC